MKIKMKVKMNWLVYFSMCEMLHKKKEALSIHEERERSMSVGSSAMSAHGRRRRRQGRAGVSLLAPHRGLFRVGQEPFFEWACVVFRRPLCLDAVFLAVLFSCDLACCRPARRATNVHVQVIAQGSGWRVSSEEVEGEGTWGG
jgi:hypothetical protein